MASTTNRNVSWTFIRGRSLDLAILTSIAFLTCTRSLVTEDISFYDEMAYIARGLKSKSGDFPTFANGATYSDLYLALSYFTESTVNLYFLGRAFAAVFLVGCVFIAARLLVRPALAAAASATVMCTPAPYVWPGVSTPAAGLVLVGVAVLMRSPQLTALGLASGAFWLAAGSRPELVWFAFAVSTLAVTVLIRSLLTKRKLTSIAGVAVVCLGALALPICLMAVHGNPWSPGGRQWTAFQQHFALNFARSDENPWLDADVVVARTFPEATGISSALAANPAAFLEHVGLNLIKAPWVLTKVGIGGLGYAGLVAAGSLVIGAVVALARNRRVVVSEIGPVQKADLSGKVLVPLIVVVLLVTASLIPIVVFYPRQHYLTPFLLLLVLGSVVVLHRFSPRSPVALVPLAAVVAAYLLFAIQTVQLTHTRISHPPPLATAANRLTDSGIEWRALSTKPGLSVYIPNLKQVEETPLGANERFSEYLRRKQVNAILLGGDFARSPWGMAQDLDIFLKEPRQFGYVEIVPGSNLYVREELL